MPPRSTLPPSSSADAIIIRGAREHNLKSIDLVLPRNRLIVVTGLSGSGKSSLAFDTLYAEGQRRYVESLSAYARQFLERLEKPEVESIEGLSPAIAIEQRTAGANPRSTVATQTEIYDYLRVLFARAGVPHCPRCRVPISRQSAQEIVGRVLEGEAGADLTILAPLIRGRKGEYAEVFRDIKRQGFVRARVDGVVRDLDEPIALDKKRAHTIEVVVDRLPRDPSGKGRLTESIETALKVGKGIVIIGTGNGRGGGPGPRGPRRQGELVFSELYACPTCGFSFEELSPRLFSFNSPYGACPSCDGLGTKLEIDPDLVVPDRDKSLREGAIEPWKRGGMHMMMYYNRLLREAARFYGADLETPFRLLDRKIQRALLYGSGDRIWGDTFEGVIPNLERRFRHTESDYVKEEIARYMSVLPDPACQGARLKPESLAVLIGERSIAAVTTDSVAACQRWLTGTRWNDRQRAVADPLIKEIAKRLQFLLDVGLGYLTLDRPSASLSGGEAQRIRLATQVGSGLVGVLYILDEPSIGLHPRDNEKLLNTLQRLRDLGNTLLVVEHDEATIRRADYLVDLGPGAGKHGGEVVACGTLEDILRSERSLTGQFLTGRRRIPVPASRRPAAGRAALVIKGASEHNLKAIDVAIPLGLFVCVTGVSGSGKSTLVDDILYRALARRLSGATEHPGRHDRITGVEHLDKVIVIDQSPIGRTPRSNPATYTEAFGPIRDLFTQTPGAKLRGFKPGRFSFNVKGGRCEACQGDGIKRIEMHFLPDVYIRCEVCKGKRFNEQTLQVAYKGRSIADVLAMTVEEALELFGAVPAIAKTLRTIQAVGLGYLELGQSATTLSGGEAQRIKLARELSRRATGRTLYLLDEPTTGLHFADVEKLLGVLHRLVEHGNTVVVIEHNLEVIKTADYLIDLGPEGGEEGGRLVASGTPEAVAAAPASWTGRFLRPLLHMRRPVPSFPSDVVRKQGTGPGIVAMLVIAAALLMLPATPARASDTDAAYTEIQQTFLREEFEQVTSLAQTFILQHPDALEVPRVWLWLALSQDRLGESSEALRELERLKGRLPSQDPVWPELLFWEGDVSRRAQEMERARSAYERLLDRFPETSWTSQARLGLGLIELHQDAFEEAVAHFRAVSSQAPETPAALDATLFEGLCYLQLKRHGEAVARLTPLLSRLHDPDAIAQAAFYLGEALTAQGNYQEAAGAYQRAIDSSTTAQWRQPALFGLGWAHYQANRCDDGVQAFERYLAQPSAGHRTEALFAQASCLMRLAREDEAVARFEQVISRDPDHPLAVESALVVADAYRRQEQHAAAKELLHGFLRRGLEEEALAQVQLRLAAIALAQGNPAQARTIYLVAAEHPDPSVRQTALGGLGDVELFIGDLGRANTRYDEAIAVAERSPLAAYARYQRGRIQLQLGAFDAAIDLFRRLTAGDDPSLADDARLALVIAYLNHDQPEAARTLLDTIRRQRPDSLLAARAAYYEALLALGDGDEAAAQQLCHALLAKAPRTDEALEARLLLADLQAKTASPREVMERLRQAYETEPLARSQRAKLAKRLGDLARAQGDYPGAIAWYEEAAALLPALESEASYRVASCYEEAGDVERAMAWYRKIGQPPWRVRGLLAVAKLLERQDRQAEATAIYQQLAEEPIPEAKLIRERLAALREAER